MKMPWKKKPEKKPETNDAEWDYVRSVVEEISFPNWNIDATSMTDMYYGIHYGWNAKDSLDDSKEVYVGGLAWMSAADVTKDKIVAFVWDVVQKGIVHEAAERFAVSGEYPYWPHPKEA